MKLFSPRKDYFDFNFHDASVGADASKDADEIAFRWKNDITELKPEAINIVLGTGKINSKTTNLADQFAITLNEYVLEKSATYPTLYNPGISKGAWEMEHDIKLRGKAGNLVIMYNKAKSYDMLRPGKGYMQKLSELEAIIKGEKDAREKAENDAKEYLTKWKEWEAKYEKIDTDYAILDRMNFNLVSKVKQDMGDRYVEDAIATDASTLESQVEEVSEDDPHE